MGWLSMLLLSALVLAPVTAGITRVSLSEAGQQADGLSRSASLSADGRVVAFESQSGSLVAGDTNGVSDVFVRDRVAGTLRRVSVSATGEQGNGQSHSPCVSATGQLVAFVSEASNLVAGDTNNVADVFVKDLATGAVQRVSVSEAGLEADGGSFWPVLTPDGRFVAFQSWATNLVVGDANNSPDIFVKNLATGVVQRASVSAAGVEADGDSYYPSISADGRTVAFESFASNLTADAVNTTIDVFLKDLETGDVRRIGVPTSGLPANGNSFHPALSADGQTVAFESWASNLVADDTNGALDVFTRSLVTGTIQRVSVSASGEGGNGNSSWPSLSSDGRTVAFASQAANLVFDDNNGKADVFVKDLSTGQVQRASLAPAWREGDSDSTEPALSGDGRAVAFTSAAGTLAADDTNGLQDVFVTDVDYTAPPRAVSATLSTVTVTPAASLVPNGTAAATVVVSVRDSSGNRLAGHAVALSATGSGNVLAQPGSSDVDGSATGTLASTVAELKTLTVTVDSSFGPVTLAAHPTVLFNTAPVAVRQSVQTLEDLARAVTLAGTDADGQALTYAVLTPPAHGTLSGTAPQLTYTPAAAFSGQDSFTFKVNDGREDSAPATVTIAVTPVNGAPVATDQSVNVAFATARAITLTAADGDGDALTYSIVNGPSHGTLSALAGSTLTYTPAADYSGADSFTFKANDGAADSNTATVSITVAEKREMVTIGSAEAEPGQTVSIPVSITDAIATVTGLDLTLQVTVPEGAPSLPNPTFSLGANAQGWQLQTDPGNPWRCMVADASGTSTPAELIRVSVSIPAEAPRGAVYVLQAQSVSITDKDANEVTSTAVVVPGQAAVLSRSLGDVNNDSVVSLADVIWVLKLYVLGETPPDDGAIWAADANRDGLISLADVILVLRHYVLGAPFPTGTS